MLLRPGDSPNPGIRLETRKGNPIPNEQRLERAPESLKAAKDIHINPAHPNRRIRSLTAAYNCIGMVVASRRTWVDTEYLIRILVDDGYRKLEGSHQAERGDVIVYRDKSGEVSHVGIVSDTKIVLSSSDDPLIIVSQWGADGEYEHPASDVPEFLGSPSEFWTDRKVLA